MKNWNLWGRISVGLLLAAVLVLGGCEQLKDQLVLWEADTSQKVKELPDNLIVKKNGFSNFDIGPGVTWFGGGKLTMLANQTASQMMSFVLETRQGNLIVIDGGTGGDTKHLEKTIQAKGGRVSAWLITHPHSDHVGALNEILRNPQSQITIDKIYYSFAPLQWYYDNEAYRADMVAKLVEAMGALPPEKLQGNIIKGQEIWVDDVKITVMNEPYLFANNSINNSSVAYKIEMNGVSMLFLGDMGVEAGNRFLSEYEPGKLRCNILQMSHHGQHGVTKQVYEAIRPAVCLWPTPLWLWDNDNGGGPGSGPWLTPETRSWMKEMGVKLNYSIKDGDQVLE